MPLVLAGATSGSATVQATDAQTVTLTLPASSGTLVVTGGAQTIEFADGSASAPSITNSGDTNTGMFFPAADTIAFTEGGVESMRIDSAGNVGIGAASAGARLQITGTTNGTSRIDLINSTSSVNASFGSVTDNTAVLKTVSASALVFATNDTERMRVTSGGLVGIGTASPTNTLQVAGGISATSASPAFQASAAIIDFSGAIARFTATGADNSTNGTMSFNTASANAGIFNERMRITSGGNVLIGTTSSTDTSSVGARLFPSGSIKSTLAESTNAGSTLDVYSTGAGLYRFYIGMAGTVFATSTTISAISDARLKENIQDIDVGLDAVMALKPRKFDWKDGKGKDIKGDRGWVAQEFEQVFPEMINEWKDPAPEGEESYKSVAADLIPVLVKAIQEQQAIITDLKARIETLENT